MDKLKIITSTTRENRVGIKIANWITKFATENSNFDVELLDLKVINLPFMDEPNHPKLGKYQHEHTKRWSETIKNSDVFILVLGEYNYGFPAPIKNALDYLHHEWKYKPVSFVSYGGISAGLRSTQMIKQVLTTLSMMPLAEQVNIPFASKFIDEEGIFQPNSEMLTSAKTMLVELKRWSDALKTLRINN